MKTLIGLDLGTTGLKGVLLDRRGQVLASAAAETVFEHPRERWVEVDPRGHLANVCAVIRELAAAAPGEVTALAMAGATGNTLLADTAGTPLTPIINWMDQRAEQEPPPALDGLTAPEVARVTGWPCLKIFPLAHLAWLRAQQPKVLAAAAHVGMAMDWLIFRLTGQWRLDHSTATTSILQDQVTGTWHEPFLRRLGIAVTQLPSLCPSGTTIGPLTDAAAESLGLSPQTMVIAGSFDHPAAARAVGIHRPGQLLLSCGTSWVGLLPHPDRDAVVAAGLLCDSFLTGSGGPWAGMFSVPAIGPAIDGYVRKLVAADDNDPWEAFNAAAAASRPGAGGLQIDLREPLQIPAAPRQDVARAVMEGAARLLAEKLDSLRARGFTYDDAIMVGGPSESELWTQILAEIARLRLMRGGRAAGARGAAMLAGIGAGWYRNETDALTTWRNG